MKIMCENIFSCRVRQGKGQGGVEEVPPAKLALGVNQTARYYTGSAGLV